MISPVMRMARVISPVMILRRPTVTLRVVMTLRAAMSPVIMALLAMAVLLTLTRLGARSGMVRVMKARTFRKIPRLLKSVRSPLKYSRQSKPMKK